ncbi:hypothetical protein P280DRAFT_112700 [Massarina eburnea CBS 473.64]|uniref:Uncharacterized protein n=1 Tax=Massarina eburnea CBS 473.64 TaxID=1395130 RepID=A0A6A6RPW4_9PLEO|nr:hypothetical protein P280DRAFT_112700 [Massarina eburnea CBS 473.64]
MNTLQYLRDELELPLPDKPTTEVSTAEDVTRESAHLTNPINDFLSLFYDDTILFSAPPHTNTICQGPTAIFWGTGLPGSQQCLITALLCLSRGHLHDWTLETLATHLDAVNETRKTHGINFVALFDYDTMVTVSYTEKTKTVLGVPAGGERWALTTILGEALVETRVRMDKALPGYTLEESDIFKLGFEKMHTSGYAVPVYDGADLRIVDFRRGVLPRPFRDAVDAVVGASKECFVTAMNGALEHNYGDGVRHGFDIIPDACVWYFDTPIPGSRQKLLCILLHKARGAIKNLPIADMIAMSETHSCPCVAWFDYESLVLVTNVPDGVVDVQKSDGPEMFCSDMWSMLRKACRLGGVKEKESGEREGVA